MYCRMQVNKNLLFSVLYCPSVTLKVLQTGRDQIGGRPTREFFSPSFDNGLTGCQCSAAVLYWPLSTLTHWTGYPFHSWFFTHTHIHRLNHSSVVWVYLIISHKACTYSSWYRRDVAFVYIHCFLPSSPFSWQLYTSKHSLKYRFLQISERVHWRLYKPITLVTDDWHSNTLSNVSVVKL